MKKTIAQSMVLCTLVLTGLQASPLNGSATTHMTQPTDIKNQQQVPTTADEKNFNSYFSLLFTHPWQKKFVHAGTVGTSVSNGLLLYVTNGGPTQLSWSACIVNTRTNRAVSSWQQFRHGTNILLLRYFPGSDIRPGDRLRINFTNNNYPSHAGALSIQGNIRSW